MRKDYFARVLSLVALAIVVFGASVATNAQAQYRKSLDFDGDGKADITAVRRYIGPVAHPYDWYTRKSSNGTLQAVQWGKNDAVAGRDDDASVYGDYDGDGKADYAVARPPVNGVGNYTWYIRNSQTGTFTYDTFGGNGADQPFAADFDGDGKTDVGVVRTNGLTLSTPATSYTWYWRSSSSGQLGYQNVGINYSNVCFPIHGDFDGDGKADFAQRCAGNETNGKLIFDIVYSSNRTRRQIQWGLYGDRTLMRAADFDGDGKSDLVAVRSVPVASPENTSTFVWYILRSSDGAVQSGYLGGFSNPGGGTYYVDELVANDYDGDGRADIAVARFPALDSNAQVYWYIQQSSNNQINVFAWGISNDTIF